MKKFSLLLLLALSGTISFAQNKEAAEKLVDEGITYHDKGDYASAIERYDKALALDKDNLIALAEKAFSLSSSQKYNESIVCCRRAIEKHPGERELSTVYVTYGNALDALNQPDKSLEVYEEGIKQFPGNYQLFFNRGVTLTSLKKYDDALLDFQRAVTLNPNHPGSHNAMARILNAQNKKIPSLLAYCRFLSIEPNTKRAKENLANMQAIVKGNVEKTGKNSVTINLALDDDKSGSAKKKENDFSSTELILSLESAMDFDKKYKDQTEIEQFIRKFELVCTSMKEIQSNNSGFYWEYYVPYFTEMKDKKLIETFAYIAFASSGNADVEKWLGSHKEEINKFMSWLQFYSWD